MTDKSASRVPKHGDLWFIPEDQPDSFDEQPAQLWHVIAIFETVFVFDMLEWPPPMNLLFEAPTRQIPSRRHYIHDREGAGPKVPDEAVLVWRENAPVGLIQP